jgi:hypothetical protein
LLVWKIECGERVTTDAKSLKPPPNSVWRILA